MTNLEVRFIQVPLAIIYKFDITTATLFGLIWSKEQLSKGFCYASQKSLSDELGIGVSTTKIKMKNLLESGLVEDILGTPSNHPGVTRKYVTNINVLNKIEAIRISDAKKKKDIESHALCHTLVTRDNSEDLKSLLKNDSKPDSGYVIKSKPDFGDSKPIFDDSESDFDRSKPDSNESQPDSGYKIYREDIEEINRDIYKENIEEISSSSADPKKEKKPTTWAEAMKAKYGEIDNPVLEGLIQTLNRSKKKLSDHPYILQRLPSQQYQVNDYEVSFILGLMEID